MRVCLLTRGSPHVLSGGHLYHRRMHAVAAAHGATVTFGTARLWPSMPSDCDVVLVDSIAAWRRAPALLLHRRAAGTTAAIVHQHPGGTDRSGLLGRAQRLLDAFVYRRCAVVIAVSRPLADALVADHGVAAARLRVVEPGCDLPAGRSGAELRRGRRVALLNVANWLPNKGILALLDALAALPEGAATLHLAGRDDVDPRYTAAVRARLAAADLAARVVVHGAVDGQTVADLCAGADVFVLTSGVEGYGTACAEALAAGLPIVGWRRPHLEALVTDGVEGCLVPPGDVEALRDALAVLADDETRRRALAAAARRRGATLPRWADTAARFFSALRGLSTRPG